MVQIRFYYTLFAALLAIAFPISSACATDVNGDGNTDIFIYRQSSNVVQSFTATGEYLSQVSVPAANVSSPPVLFPGVNNRALSVFSLVTSGANQDGTLYRFSGSGLSGTLNFGPMKNSVLMLYDIDNDGNTDSIHVTKSGGVSTRLRIFEPGEQEIVKSIKKLKRQSRVSLTAFNGNPYVVVYTAKKKKKRTSAVLYPLIEGNKQTFRVNRKIKKQIYPHLSATGLSFGHFSAFNENKNGTIAKFQHLDLFANRVRTYKVGSSSALIPGFFTSSGSSLQIFNVAGSGKVLDLRSNANLIGELDLGTLGSGITPPATPTPVATPDFPTPTPTPGFQTPTPTPTPFIPTPTPTPTPTPQFGCNNQYPTALIAQLQTAHQTQNTTLINSTLAAISSLGPWCNSTYTSIQRAINQIFNAKTSSFTRSAVTVKNSGAVTILTSPLVSYLTAGGGNGGGGNNGGGNNGGGSGNPSDIGCDHEQDGSDGAGGFVLKDGDHDGNLVILLPEDFSTTNVYIYDFNGNRLQKMRYTGRSNGFRETYRGDKPSSQYPKQLIFKAVVQPFGAKNATNECFVIENAHVRND